MNAKTPSAGQRFSRISGVAGAGLASLLLLVLAGGCAWMEPKVTSPYSGKEASAGEIAAERMKLEGEERAAAAGRMAALAEASEQARSEAKRAARLVGLKARTDAARAEAELAEIEDAGAAAAAASIRQIAVINGGLEARLASVAEQFDVAAARIEAERAARLGVLKFVADNPMVKMAAASVGLDTGGIGSLGGALLGVGGAAFMASRARKREHEAWDESAGKAKAEAEAAAGKAAAQQQMLMLALMGRFDANKNGVLDAAEMAAARAEGSAARV